MRPCNNIYSQQEKFLIPYQKKANTRNNLINENYLKTKIIEIPYK